MKAEFQDDANVRSRTLEKFPEVTPKGNPTNDGVWVAIPAVEVKGTAVQQWMCDAVVVPCKPLNDALTANVCAASSIVTVAKPVPGDAFGGDSAGPERSAPYVIIFAW